MLMLEENLKILKDLTEKNDLLKEGLRKKKEKFDEENKDTLENIKLTEESVNNIKKEIENVVLNNFNITKSKKYLGGVSIKEYKKLIYDKEKALEFAKEKDLFLVLDEKSFEKSAESLNLNFVEIKLEPKVTFPKVIKLED